jgi:hypothetical protein
MSLNAFFGSMIPPQLHLTNNKGIPSKSFRFWAQSLCFI